MRFFSLVSIPALVVVFVFTAATTFGPNQTPGADAHFHACDVPASCGSHPCEPESFAAAGGEIHCLAQQLAVLDRAGLLEVLGAGEN